VFLGDGGLAWDASLGGVLLAWSGNGRHMEKRRGDPLLFPLSF